MRSTGLPVAVSWRALETSASATWRRDTGIPGAPRVLGGAQCRRARRHNPPRFSRQPPLQHAQCALSADALTRGAALPVGAGEERARRPDREHAHSEPYGRGHHH